MGNTMPDVLDEQALTDLTNQGWSIYNVRLKSTLEPDFNGQVVAIHVDSGDYALGRNSTMARRVLRQRHSGGPIVTIDVGVVPNNDPLSMRMSQAMIAPGKR